MATEQEIRVGERIAQVTIVGRSSRTATIKIGDKQMRALEDLNVSYGWYFGFQNKPRDHNEARPFAEALALAINGRAELQTSIHQDGPRPDLETHYWLVWTREGCPLESENTDVFDPQGSVLD